MNEYALGKDIQLILAKLDVLTDRAVQPAPADDRESNLLRAAVRSQPGAVIYNDARNTLSYHFAWWSHDYMIYENTSVVLNANGNWSLEVDARNTANYRRYYAWYGFYVAAAGSDIEAFRVQAWEGYYGAGYRETKRGSGNDVRVRDYFEAMRRGEFLLGPWSTLERKN